MSKWYAKSFRKGTNAFAKYYDGSQWVKKPLKFYDGTTWTTRNGSPTDIRAQILSDSTSQTALGATKYWNGSAWIVRDALAQESYDIVAKDASSGGNTITSVNEGSSVYFHITGRQAGETLYYQITSYLPSSNATSINFANDFSAPSSSSGTITTGLDKVGILQVTTSADNDPENTPENFQIEIYSDFNGSKGDLESFSNVITINDTSSAANPTTSGSYGTVSGNQYLDSFSFGDTEGNDTGVTNFIYTFPTNTPLGHYYFVIWGGYSNYTGNSPATARDANSGSMNTRITIGLLVTQDNSVVPQATVYNSTELGYTKNTVTHQHNNINRVQINNTTQGTSFDTTLIFPNYVFGDNTSYNADRYFGLDTDSPDKILHVAPGDSISVTVRMTKTFGASNVVRFNHNAF
jgi:hypothetical protein